MAPSLVPLTSDYATDILVESHTSSLLSISEGINRPFVIVPALRWFLVILAFSQLAAYHVRHASDRFKFRAQIGAILALAALHFALVSSVLTYFYAVNYRTWNLWPQILWFKALILLLVVLRSCVVQMFILRRHIRRSPTYAFLLLPTISTWLVSVVGSLVILVVVSAPQVLDPSPFVFFVSRFSLTFGLACDILLAVMLHTRPDGDAALKHTSGTLFSFGQDSSVLPTPTSSSSPLKRPRRRSISMGSTKPKWWEIETVAEAEEICEPKLETPSVAGHRRHSTAQF